MHRAVPVVLLLVLAAAPARAADPAGPGEGLTCGFSAVADPTQAGGDRLGTVDAGPVVVADGSDPRSGRIRCSIQINGDRHSDPDAVSETSPTTPGVVALPPTPVRYYAGQEDYVVLCTEVEIDGAGTFYYDEVEARWSTDPSVACAYASVPEPDPLDGLFDTIDPWILELVEPTVCPPFSVIAPPQGDIYVADTFVWDCPPYE